MGSAGLLGSSLADYSPEQVQDRMGGPNHDVPPELIRKVAGMFADATRKRLARSKGKQAGKGYGGVIIMWGIGYNQHIHGQNNTVSLINGANVGSGDGVSIPDTGELTITSGDDPRSRPMTHRSVIVASTCARSVRKLIPRLPSRFVRPSTVVLLPFARLCIVLLIC